MMLMLRLNDTCLSSVSALRVRQKMCGKGRPILMIGDLLCENVSILCEQ